MAPHSSTLACKIPWIEEPGGLQSMGSLRVRHDFTFTFHFHALEKEMATHSSVLAWRLPGTVEPGGLPSMGSHRVGHDWNDLAAAAAALSESSHAYAVVWDPANPSYRRDYRSTFYIPTGIDFKWLLPHILVNRMLYEAFEILHIL